MGHLYLLLSRNIHLWDICQHQQMWPKLFIHGNNHLKRGLGCLTAVSLWKCFRCRVCSEVCCYLQVLVFSSRLSCPMFEWLFFKEGSITAVNGYFNYWMSCQHRKGSLLYYIGWQWWMLGSVWSMTSNCSKGFFFQSKIMVFLLVRRVKRKARGPELAWQRLRPH